MDPASVFSAVESLEAKPRWNPTDVGAALNLTLQYDPAGSDQYSTVFKAAGSPSQPWQNLEMRVMKADAAKALIILHLRETNWLDMKEVVAHFGKDQAFSPPDPRNRNEATAYYLYKRPHGVLRFVFRDFDHYKAETIVLDRT